MADSEEDGDVQGCGDPIMDNEEQEEEEVEGKPATKRIKLETPDVAPNAVTLHLSEMAEGSPTSESASSALAEVAFHIVNDSGQPASTSITQALGDVSGTTNSSIQIVPIQGQESVSVREMVGSAVLDAGSGGQGGMDLLGAAAGQEMLDPVLVVGQEGLGEPNKEGDVELPSHSASVLDPGTQQLILASSNGGSSSNLLESQLASINGHTMQIFHVQSADALAQATSQGPKEVQLVQSGGKVFQLVAADNNPEVCSVIALNSSGEFEVLDQSKQEQDLIQQAADGTAFLSAGTPLEVSTLRGGGEQGGAPTLASLLPLPGINTAAISLPHDTPTWAARLHDCQKIGKAYRGWVETEVELDLLLTLHKQQTQSFWGTRQSPCPAKPSTRLMWKSQYVPFDGIPFINAGSRAIVMECQYGPRRKGGNALAKRLEGTSKMEFRQTCPARIYVKKVKKFPQFGVNVNLDKKSLHVAMGKSFQMLKDAGLDSPGLERFYVELPLESAHEFHMDVATTEVTTPIEGPSRLDPRVAQKVRDMVAGGETRLYVIRKSLRRYVEKELFESAEQVPQKHNLTFYPTVNDLQNHIHRAMKDIESGTLPVTAQTVNVEIITSGDYQKSLQEAAAAEDTLEPETVLDAWGKDSSACKLEDGGTDSHPETVTVTLTQNPDQEGHVISRVETHMSDGTTEVSTSLTADTAKLLARLHPNMFPAGSFLRLTETEDGKMASIGTDEQESMSSSPVTQDNHTISLPDATHTDSPNNLQQTSVFLEQQGVAFSGAVEALGGAGEEVRAGVEGQEFTVVVNQDGVHQIVHHIDDVSSQPPASPSLQDTTANIPQSFPHASSPTL